MSAALTLLLAPVVFTAAPLPSIAERVMTRATPIAGLAVQASGEGNYEPPIGPWTGLAVTWIWAMVGLLTAMWLTNRRDV